MKRFTATEKWQDGWYRKLRPALKCLWQYLCDHCDPAGVIEPDWELVSFQIGETLGLDDIAALGGRVAPFGESKVEILGFIEFQYGKLSADCKAHIPIFRALEKHRLSIPSPKAIHSLQEKEEEEEEEQEEEKETETETEEAFCPGARRQMIQFRPRKWPGNEGSFPQEMSSEPDCSPKPSRGITPSPPPDQKLAACAWALRLGIIAAVVGGLAGLFAYAGRWLSPHALTPARFTDGFEQASGRHPGFRRNHSKGVGVAGYFESNGRGAEFSKARVFQPGRVPILGRFSLGGGMPDITDSPQTVRGLGICFQLSGAQEWRMAMINFPVFPFRNPQAFYENLQASVPDPATGKPNPDKMRAFLAAHPESAAALKIIGARKISSGFENSEFRSLNAFRLADGQGKQTWARWSVVPAAPEETKSPASSPADKNYLFAALSAAVHRQPLTWRLLLTIADPGDPTNDATLPWPPDRKSVEVGTLVVDHIESDDTSPARDLNFDPLILPDGISPSDDPLLSARSAVYSQSFTRREGERKSPSPVSREETEK